MQAGSQRRTNVQALPRNGSAVYAFAESGIRAARGGNDGASHRCSLEVEVSGGDAVCRRQGRKGGGGEPLRAGRGHALALSLVGEEGKDPVLPDGSADAAAQLVVTIFVPQQATLIGCQPGASRRIKCLYRRRAIPTLIRIQSRASDLDEETTVEIVRAALRCDFGQRT